MLTAGATPLKFAAKQVCLINLNFLETAPRIRVATSDFRQGTDGQKYREKAIRTGENTGVVGLGRVELPTRSLGNCCSIHLSYSPSMGKCL